MTAYAPVPLDGHTVRMEALLPYGFRREPAGFRYETILPHSQFLLSLLVSEAGAVSSCVTDPASGEPYTLHLQERAAGGFVGGVRTDYEAVRADFLAACCQIERFQTALAKSLLAYARSTYGSSPEYLWEKFPDYAVLRRGDNQKWYAVLLIIPKQKLGLPSPDRAEVLDLRGIPERLQLEIDHQRYFPGWHMNKKHWYTVLLDGSISDEELRRRMDESYALAGKK